MSYRIAYLLLPLQHIRYGVVARELHVAVEHNGLTKYRGDVHGILWVLYAATSTAAATTAHATYKRK